MRERPFPSPAVFMSRPLAVRLPPRGESVVVGKCAGEKGKAIVAAGGRDGASNLARGRTSRGTRVDSPPPRPASRGHVDVDRRGRLQSPPMGEEGRVATEEEKTFPLYLSEELV